MFCSSLGWPFHCAKTRASLASCAIGGDFKSKNQARSKATGRLRRRIP